MLVLFSDSTKCGMKLVVEAIHVISFPLTSGDVAFRVLERSKSVGHRAMQGTLTDTEEDTHIYVCDINPNMLNVGKKRAAERGLEHEIPNIYLFHL